MVRVAIPYASGDAADSSPLSIWRLSVSSPRAHALPYHATKSGPAIRDAPRKANSVVTSTRVAVPARLNTSVATNGAAYR
jgi:hypothetical protein